MRRSPEPIRRILALGLAAALAASLTSPAAAAAADGGVSPTYDEAYYAKPHRGQRGEKLHP